MSRDRIKERGWIYENKEDIHIMRICIYFFLHGEDYLKKNLFIRFPILSLTLIQR